VYPLDACGRTVRARYIWVSCTTYPNSAITLLKLARDKLVRHEKRFEKGRFRYAIILVLKLFQLLHQKPRAKGRFAALPNQYSPFLWDGLENCRIAVQAICTFDDMNTTSNCCFANLVKEIIGSEVVLFIEIDFFIGIVANLD